MMYKYSNKSTWYREKEITLTTGKKCKLYNFYIYEYGSVKLYWTESVVYLNHGKKCSLLGKSMGVWRVYTTKHWIIIDNPYIATSNPGCKSNTVKIFTYSLALILSTRAPIKYNFDPLDMKIPMLKMKLIKLIEC